MNFFNLTIALQYLSQVAVEITVELSCKKMLNQHSVFMDTGFRLVYVLYGKMFLLYT
jgi:hypothetical protein